MTEERAAEVLRETWTAAGLMTKYNLDNNALTQFMEEFPSVNLANMAAFDNSACLTDIMNGNNDIGISNLTRFCNLYVFLKDLPQVSNKNSLVA